MSTLDATYKNEEIISPFVARLNVSNENVEKVVKPPQKPTINKAFNLGFISPALFRAPISTPNNKQPKTLIVKVAKGKVSFQYETKRRLTRNRKQVPTKPPIPAKIISFHIAKKINSFFTSKLNKKAG